MSDDPYVPFDYDEAAANDYLTLVPGVPTWLRQPLLNWVSKQVTWEASFNQAYGRLCLDIQLHARVDINVIGVGSDSAELDRVIRGLFSLSEAELLRVADYLLSRQSGSTISTIADQLERVLAAGRSKWRVGERRGSWGLVAREPEAVQEGVEDVISTDGEAHRLLARAWMKIHELEPDATGAYADAVRAAETASVGLVLPNKGDATLGDVAGAIGADDGWNGPLRPHTRAPSNETLAAMLRTLYSGHRDRHGSSDYRDVTPSEARAAILLATVLVDWFTSGGVTHP